MEAINILHEYTGRYSVLYTFLSSLTNLYDGYLVKSFHESDIEAICESATVKTVFIILGENDIVKYGDKIRLLSPQSIHLYPTLQSAKIETSKSYCRHLLHELNVGKYNPYYLNIVSLAGIPDDLPIENMVVKCDGLSNGKGVWVSGDHFTTREAAHKLIVAGLDSGTVLLEEKLYGDEFSIHTFCYNGVYKHSPCVRDFKRRNVGNTGPNTGGMGTISYENGLMPFLDYAEYEECCKLNELVAQATDFAGFLYGSFMKTRDDKLKVIEYNCRPGDSEFINLVMLSDFNPIRLLSEYSCGSNRGSDGEVDDKLKGILESAVKFKPYASLCTYIVDKDYCVGTNTLQGDEYVVLDVINVGLNGYFPAKLELETPLSAGRSSGPFGNIRNKYRYDVSSRLMAVCATSDDIDELIDIHANLCSHVKGNRIEWRSDIPKYLLVDETPLSSDRSTPCVGVNGDARDSVGYLSHLDNYNSIMSGVKVRIDTVNKKIKDQTIKPITLTGEIGDFANSIKYGNTTLICSVDGAGTKTKFMVDDPQRFRVLGNDVVIHNINDMMCNNGTPVAFLDYYGCDKLRPEEFAAYIDGILEICDVENIPLIGGETAEMRGIYQPDECEVLGILLGVALDTRNGCNNDIVDGTLIYGIRSHGAHTNGFTKLRDIADKYDMPDYVRRYFSQPHRNYRPVFSELVNTGVLPLAKAHITGGGFVDNLMRVVSSELQNCLTPVLQAWDTILSPEWDWVYKHSDMSWSEFIRVFNAGFGMCFMVNEPINMEKLPAKLACDIQLLGAFFAIH